MPKSRKWINLAIAAMFAAFAYGAMQLYLLRFAAGDVYPPYSSYRADPVGTRALYESLESLPGLSVERHAKPFSIDSVSDTIGNTRSTWMLLGASAYDLRQPWLSPNQMPLDFARGIERIMQQGGRVVISIQPTFEDLQSQYAMFKARMDRIDRMRKERDGRDDKEEEDRTDPSDGSDPPDQMAEAPETDGTGQAEKPTEADGAEEPGDSDDAEGVEVLYEDLPVVVELDERWGLRLAFDDVQVDDTGQVEAQEAKLVAGADLPESVNWRTVTWFNDLTDEWDVIYERDGNPVLIERPFGAGSLVFSADSYFLSNEALRNDRHPALLSWLVGANRLLIFEESHLGVARVPGIMTLVRGYGLYGVFWGLIALGVLFLWKNAIAFVPPYADEMPADARHAAGRDSAAGFANLIRRSVKPRELLQRCLTQYKYSLGARRDDLKGPIGKMESVAETERLKPANEWNPVEAYRAMCRILDEHLRG